MSFPFRFYGRRPADWVEGANLGHLYELRFATAEPDRAAAERAAREALATGAAEASPKPWRWDGVCALMIVGERYIGKFEAFFNGMERILRAVHAVAPLEQVVFLGVRAPGSHPWDAWSIAEQPQPTPGPRWW